jgi:plastocyanin
MPVRSARPTCVWSESETGTADGTPTGTQLHIKAGEPTHEFGTDRLAVPANKPFTIRFTNLDESSHGQHNIEIEDVFKGRKIDGFGESVTYKIGPLRAGTYKFLCTTHPFMQGTLVVK